MPADLPSGSVLRAVCLSLEAGIHAAPDIIEDTGYSKRCVWMALQWLQAHGFSRVVKTGRRHAHHLVAMPSDELFARGPDAVELARAEDSRWDARALFAALHWSPLPAGRLRTVILGEPL